MRRALAVAAAVALTAAVAGFAALAMIGGAGCATTEIDRAPDGAWRIEEVGCGATVGLTWRLVVRGRDGRERLAVESQLYPDILDAALDGDRLRVRLGTTGDAWRDIPLDADRRPVAPLRLREGQPRG